MKKIAPLILIVLLFVVVGGIYISKHMPENLLVPSVAPNPSDSTQPASGASVDFKNYGKAPEFAGIDHWLNSTPLTIAGLKSKVVLIDFWTYSCINCIRTLPYVTKLYDTYKDKGLVVVGVHTPEFAFEKETGNVEDAIKRFNIHYPVAQDNNYGTWGAYNNQYWPAEYLIDKNGDVVHAHFGEGEYDVTENAVRTLLGLNTLDMTKEGSDLSGVNSPEMYFGTDRLKNLTPKQTASSLPKTYSLPRDLALNNFALEGNWQFSPENIRLASGQGKIRLKFHAGKVHLVASSQNPALLKITVDGKSQPTIIVKNSELYTLFDSNDYSDHVIEITVDTQDFEAFTLTFG